PKRGAARQTQRRSLSVVRGQPKLVEAVGNAEDLARLRHIVDVPTAAAVRNLTHGFHAYPAKLHPVWARRAIAAYTAAGALVVDPFVGSGTTLVEAMVAGRVGIGIDTSPLAVQLATLKTRRLSGERRKRLRSAGQAVAGRVLVRVNEDRLPRLD